MANEFQLKPIHADAIPEAIEKAERYRLLNEPAEAASICQDILDIDQSNQAALVILLLSTTDMFDQGAAMHSVQGILSRLAGEYERAYYAGVAAERWAKAQLRHGMPGSNFIAYDFFREAMEWFEKAEAIRPPGNDDAILRWNTCARILMGSSSLRPKPEEAFEPILSD